MKTGIKRKKKLDKFTLKEYGINAVLMAIIFLFGLYFSWELSNFAGMLYLLLWVASYFVIHATTCRNCVYHGKQCPVPLEGGCSHLTFERGNNFGLIAGVGGLLAFFLRLCIPYVAIIKAGSMMYFVLYSGIVILFFYVLLYHTGCPNCINTKCPMNPDFNAPSQS
ncbi:hypothetical protein DSCW_59420 [Desulfosarcina widdelii]|uniref:Uncharacterized protein n=1 Tax=Desulfosarcina widdelii TaxID=947919 RepID=A0A5K7ZCM0_9BACT|nr:hypothetical protein [Desulfosarcina widdelii]BBO78525.1 hypothetical protein DSCW_59420 [Desulfosarcina widdelii]